MNDPFTTFDAIKNAYLRYLESPFRLRYDDIMEDRRALLDKDGQLYRDPLFEAAAPYVSSGNNVASACAALGADPRVGDFITSGLFSADAELYTHQLKAWEISRAGSPVVITSGTGSGKTECFLLPLFAALADEALSSWGTPCPPQPTDAFWWRKQGYHRVPQRQFEQKTRPAAVRALMLYPLNALVEDQLGRIRIACDSPAARLWLQTHGKGHRFWFGRYVGATPVSGRIDGSQTKKNDLKKELSNMEREWREAGEAHRAHGDSRILSFFQDPAGSEMWSRWDMQQAPPDIMITNYSMLNIMLMRHAESDVFETTRQWLAADPRHVFHMIVDELHSYRGTPGTEVAYLLRAFLDRIGLRPDSTQLRIIATSASIEDKDPKSREYLEDFFGRQAADFVIVPGERREFFMPPNANLVGCAGAFAEFAKSDDAATLADALGVAVAGQDAQTLDRCVRETGLLEAVRRQGENAPFTANELAKGVFGDLGQLQPARGLVKALIRARSEGDRPTTPMPLRGHFFFRNASRLWACVNRRCGGVRAPSAERPVGTLFLTPQPRCPHCSARVLELLYCQTCGDVFLGGYKVETEATGEIHLSPDFPYLETLPDKGISLGRLYADYAVFWPAHGRSLDDEARTWTHDKRSVKWSPARLDVKHGRLAMQPQPAQSTDAQAAGYAFFIAKPDDKAPGLSSRCPHCGEDWGQRQRGPKSPIRFLSPGIQRVTQLMYDALLGEIDDDTSRKLVLFSDSRQDAAKLATGIKNAHYLDALRQAAFCAILAQKAARSSIRDELQELLELEKTRSSGPLTDAQKARRKTLRAQYAEEAVAIQGHVEDGDPLPDALGDPAASATVLSVDALMHESRRSLLARGINPGGMGRGVTQYDDADGNLQIAWPQIIDWNAFDFKPHLQGPGRQLHDAIFSKLRESLLTRVLFATGGRDFEALRLGYIAHQDRPPSGAAEEVAASVLRLLAQSWRIQGVSDPSPNGRPPRRVQKFLKRVEKVVTERETQELLGEAVSHDWLINPDKLFVLTPHPNSEGEISLYRCSRCKRIHLHGSGRVCTQCGDSLDNQPAREMISSERLDYYEYLARTAKPLFRLNSAELTGQTDAEERRKRQRLFQDIFIKGEEPRAAAVDLLSVTTTMEAGVDIGSLLGVGMANMPPIRFNYQQRVGRAGRRGIGFSVALTFCRSRTHDEYYFERPGRITSAPSPTPTLDTSREEIALRVVHKELLRRAFASIALEQDEPLGGPDVHGEFGTIEDWTVAHGQTVRRWMLSNPQEALSVCRAILVRTKIDPARMADEVKRLADRIDAEISRHSDIDTAGPLSKLLAGRGLLPMFGFPTRVRYLFHEEPKSYPIRRGAIDRNLDIAVSQFAPGAQTVKDDALHTAIGVVDYRPYRGGLMREPDPLSHRRAIGVCRRCQAITTAPAGNEACPVCGAPADPETGFRVTEVCEPPGFISLWTAKAEFEGNFDYTPQALRARTAAPANAPQSGCNFLVDDLRQAEVFQINDNDGKDFDFVAGDRAFRNIWVTEDGVKAAVDTMPQADRASVRKPDIDRAAGVIKAALASITTTDVMTLELASLPSRLRLDPSTPEGRAVWYSFGFLLRRAAATYLDIPEGEINLGLQPHLDTRLPWPTARLFLSDSLENGAGYSSYFADPREMEKLLRFILSPEFCGPLFDAGHRRDCSSSCHRCLRDFANMRYHPLLDWRIGLDMARLALDATAMPTLQTDYWQDIVARVEREYYAAHGLQKAQIGGVPAGLRDGKAYALRHPMWAEHDTWQGPELAGATVAARRDGLTLVIKSLFDVIRVPYAL